MTLAEKNLHDILKAWASFTPPKPTRIVKTVPCPRCNGEGTTAGAMSYGSNVEACETCRHCGGRCVVEREVTP